MKVAYVAGPYRAENNWLLEQNVRAAEEMGLKLATRGLASIVPHTMSRYFHGTLTETYWLAATQELVKRCDIMLVLPGWENSSGTLAEIALAKTIQMPVFYDLEKLCKSYGIG